MGWRQKGPRGIGPGMKNPTGWYIKIAPNFGISIPWFGGARLRIAWHHGIQLVKWVGGRWYVTKQILGKSKVKGERYI